MWAKEVLQVSLQGLHSGQLLGKVYGSHTWEGSTLVQLILQCTINLIQGTE